MKVTAFLKYSAIQALVFGFSLSAGAAEPEYAAYNGKNSSDTVIVIRDQGKVRLLTCYAVYPEGVEDPKAAKAVKEFAAASCSAPHDISEDGLTTRVDLNYISGNTQAVVTVSQVFKYPENSADAGELGSVVSTYSINTYANNPVGVGDTVSYTGARIVHDHGAAPRLSTARITYELVGVTRAN